MFKSPSIKLLITVIFFITFHLSSIESANIKCNYRTVIWPILGNAYVCDVLNNEIFDGSRIKIDSAVGNHKYGITNDDVTAIKIINAENVNFFPKNIENVFTNLIAIQIADSQLQEITQNDLKPFNKLQGLYLSKNDLKFLQADLFKFNPQLKEISLHKNKISRIDVNTFDGLNQLESLSLRENNCQTSFEWAQTRSDVMKVMKRIKNGECISAEFHNKSYKFDGISNTLIKNQVFENLRQSLRESERKNEEISLNFSTLNSENNEMNLKYTTALNEKQILTKNLQELQDKLTESEVNIKKLKNEVLELRNKISEDENHHKNCQSNLTDCKEQLQQNLQTFNIKLNEEISKNSLKNLQQSQTDLQNLQIKFSQSEKIIEKLETEKANINSDLEVCETEIDYNRKKRKGKVLVKCSQDEIDGSDADDDGTCGIVKVTKDGKASYAGQWPWLASIFLNETRFSCGSSIISQWHLLTAAHCKIHDVISLYHTLLGRFDLTNSREVNWQRRDISAIYVHPGYSSSAKYSRSKDDLAIFKVSKKIRYTAYIQPICLPDMKANAIDVDGIVVGYGQTKAVGTHESTPNFVDLKSVDQWKCLLKDGVYNQMVSENSFCASNNKSNPCQSDSGGGFYVYNQTVKRFETFGVVSYGIYRCDPKDFVAFVDVTKYIGWIREKLDADFN